MNSILLLFNTCKYVSFFFEMCGPCSFFFAVIGVSYCWTNVIFVRFLCCLISPSSTHFSFQHEVLPNFKEETRTMLPHPNPLKMTRSFWSRQSSTGGPFLPVGNQSLTLNLHLRQGDCNNHCSHCSQCHCCW